MGAAMVEVIHTITKSSLFTSADNSIRHDGTISLAKEGTRKWSGSYRDTNVIILACNFICNLCTYVVLYYSLRVPEKPSCWQATSASSVPHMVSQIEPHWLKKQISTRPSRGLLPPTSLISPVVQTRSTGEA